MIIQEHSGRKLRVDGKNYLNFTGTSYLNLPYNETFQNYFINGMKKYGLSTGTSPLNKPSFEIYNKLEKALAKKYGFETAILFQTGFAASQAIIQLQLATGFSIHYSPISHPALKIEHQETSNKVYATDYHDIILNKYILNNEFIKPNKTTIVDASHAFGILDEDLITLSKKNHKVIYCGSLNKALGINAGLVLCPKHVKEKLNQLPIYNTSSLPSQASCYALYKTIKGGLLTKQQKKLNQLLNSIPESENYHFKAPVPILFLKDTSQAVFDELRNNGLFIWRNEYPKGTGKTINRVVINAGLKLKDFTKLLKIIA